MKQIDERKLERQMMRVVNGVERYAQVWSCVAMVALFTLSALIPQAAFAQVAGGSLNGLCTNATNAIGYIKIGVYFILVVAVIGSGVAAAFGRMEWATVGRVLIGCIVAGLATALVGVLYGSSGC